MFNWLLHSSTAYNLYIYYVYIFVFIHAVLLVLWYFKKRQWKSYISNDNLWSLSIFNAIIIFFSGIFEIAIQVSANKDIHIAPILVFTMNVLLLLLMGCITLVNARKHIRGDYE